MAQKARKDRAKSNIASLNSLHIGTLAVNAFFIIWCFVLPFTAKRSILTYIILSIPGLVAEYILETTGRPKYVGNELKSAGEDLAAPGLTEYLFDVVWVTWGSLIAVILFGNWGWLLWVRHLRTCTEERRDADASIIDCGSRVRAREGIQFARDGSRNGGWCGRSRGTGATTDGRKQKAEKNGCIGSISARRLCRMPTKEHVRYFCSTTSLRPLLLRSSSLQP
jgi:hypothetical protein